MRSLRDFRFRAVHFGVLAALLFLLSTSALCRALDQSPGQLFQRLEAALLAELGKRALRAPDKTLVAKDGDRRAP